MNARLAHVYVFMLAATIQRRATQLGIFLTETQQDTLENRDPQKSELIKGRRIDYRHKFFNLIFISSRCDFYATRMRADDKSLVQLV